MKGYTTAVMKEQAAKMWDTVHKIRAAGGSVPLVLLCLPDGSISAIQLEGEMLDTNEGKLGVEAMCRDLFRKGYPLIGVAAFAYAAEYDRSEESLAMESMKRPIRENERAKKCLSLMVRSQLGTVGYYAQMQPDNTFGEPRVFEDFTDKSFGIFVGLLKERNMEPSEN